MEKIDLINCLTDIWFRMDSAKSLVDDGKEVQCSNKLQGALTCLNNLIKNLGDELKKKNELV